MTIIDAEVACDVASHNHAFHLTALRQMNAIVKFSVYIKK
jgi:hypothetical protein